MALIDEIKAWNQFPWYTVQYGTKYIQNVVGIRMERQYDQQAASCHITVAVPSVTVTPNNFTEVKVFLGYWNSGSLLAQVFSGYVDDVVQSRFPNSWDIICRDRLKKAIEFWIEFDEEFVVSEPTQAETVVSDLLGLAELTVTAGTSDFTISDTNPAKFKGISSFDAASQVAALLGWRIWCGVDGTIYFQHQRPLPASTAYWRYEVGQNVLDYEHTITDRNLRNKCEVVGYEEIKSTAFADSPHVQDPDYRVAIFSSELVDTQDMADTIAARIVNDLNHLTFSARVKVVGNPLIDVGKTIEFLDRSYGLSGRYFVFGITHTMDENNGFETEMTIVKPDDFVPNINYEPPDPPEPDDPPDPPPDPPTPPTGPTGDGSRTYIATDVGVAYTNNLLDPTPTWTAINTGLSGDALNVFRMLFDPFSATDMYLSGAYLVTKDGIYKNTALPTGTWTQILSPAELEAGIGSNHASYPICQFTRELVCPIVAQDVVGFMAVKTLSNGQGRYYWVYSGDGGATWNFNTTNWFDQPDLPNAHGYVNGMHVVPSDKTYGVLHVVCNSRNLWNYTDPIVGSVVRNYLKSTDNGSSFTSAPTTWFSLSGTPGILHFPYADGSGAVYADDTRAWRFYQNAGGGYDVQVTDGFPNPVSPTDWEYFSSLISLVGVNDYLRWLDMCTWNENYVYVLSYHVGTPVYSVYYTNDGGTTWNTADPSGGKMIYSALSCLPGNELVCMVATNAGITNSLIYLTQDGGPTWSDKKGDLNTIMSTITAIRTIVPDWIKIREEGIVP